MKVTLIEVPYDSGHYARRMGRGPVHLLQGGLRGVLEEAGHSVRIVEVRLDDRFLTEVGSAIEIQRLVAECVGGELAEGRFPLVLSGNCSTAIGSVAGVEGESTGVVWLDAHGDFNTPETISSGFFDAQALAMLTGDCWRAASASVPGFAPVAERDIALVGARDFIPAERERLEASEVHRVEVEAIRTLGAAAALERPLADLRSRTDGFYLHLDLDVLDPQQARVNAWQAADGLTIEEVEAVVDAVASQAPLHVAALTSFDPETDEDGAAGAAAVRLVTLMCRLGAAE